MRLGQGSHPRTPVWVWLTLAVCCAMLLPSAAVSTAQDTNALKVPKVEESKPVPSTNSEKVRWQFAREVAVLPPLALVLKKAKKELGQLDTGSIFVEGIVAKPGRFLLTNPTTLSEAIADAGGLVLGQKISEIVICRFYRDDLPVLTTRIDLCEAESGQIPAVADNISLRESDFIYVSSKPLDDDAFKNLWKIEYQLLRLRKALELCDEPPLLKFNEKLIRISGPTRQGAQINFALEPPSDAEMIRPFEGTNDGRKISFENVASVVKEKIADYVDATKFIPLIGNTRLRHSVYKCSLFLKSDPDIPIVFYVDHQHFHMMPNETSDTDEKRERK